MAGTRLRGGVDGLPAAGMQADCRSLQMIAVAFCGSHDVKGVVDLRSAELRLVCADQYFAAESLFYQRQLIAAAGAISVMRSPKPVPYARPPVRQNGMSAPNVAAMVRRRLYGQFSSQRRLTASMVAAGVG